MVALALEDMHDLPDAVDAAPGILGLAVPNPPAQPLDLRDDHGLRLHPIRLVGRQSDGRLLRVLEPHGDMEPVRDWWIRDPGIGQNRSQAGAAVAERGQLRLIDSAYRLQVSADRHREVSIGPRDGGEYLTASGSRLDVADANFQMPFAVMAATDEGRVHSDRDGRRGRRRLDRGVAKLLPRLERMAAQRLGALSGLDRQKMLQHASRHAIRHKGGKMRSELVQLRCRPTMRWPADARLGAATASAEKPRQPHGYPAEQRLDVMKPPVLDVAFPSAGRAIRPQNRMVVGLRGNDRFLNTRQKLLCLRQRQPQIRDIAKVVGPADLQHLDTPCPAVGPRFDQLQSPPHPRSPSRQRPDRSYRFRPYAPSLRTLPPPSYSAGLSICWASSSSRRQTSHTQTEP